MPKKWNLSEEQIKDLGELTQGELRDKYGWKLTQVVYLRRKYNVKIIRKGKLTEEQIQDLSNLNSAELQEKYGWNSVKVSNYRRLKGITDFPRMRNRRIDVPSVEALEGKSVTKLMEEFGVCRSTVKKWLNMRELSPIRDHRVRELKNENKKLVSQLNKMRMMAIFPYMSNSEIARAFNLSRERIRQIRERVGIQQMKWTGPSDFQRDLENIESQDLSSFEGVSGI